MELCVSPLHEKAKGLAEREAVAWFTGELAVHGLTSSRAITGRELDQSPAGSLSVGPWVSPKESSCGISQRFSIGFLTEGD